MSNADAKKSGRQIPTRAPTPGGIAERYAALRAAGQPLPAGGAARPAPLPAEPAAEPVAEAEAPAAAAPEQPAAPAPRPAQPSSPARQIPTRAPSPGGVAERAAAGGGPARAIPTRPPTPGGVAEQAGGAAAPPTRPAAAGGPAKQIPTRAPTPGGVAARAAGTGGPAKQIPTRAPTPGGVAARSAGAGGAAPARPAAPAAPTRPAAPTAPAARPAPAAPAAPARDPDEVVALRELIPDLAFERVHGYVEVTLPKEQLLGAATLLEYRFEYDYLSSITAVDWSDRIEMVYHLYSFDPKKQPGCTVLRVNLERPAYPDYPTVQSLTPLWPGAEFQEREVYDLMGVKFVGHPDLRRILLSDDFPGHPLRKDFVIDYQYVLVQHLRYGIEGQFAPSAPPAGGAR